MLKKIFVLVFALILTVFTGNVTAGSPLGGATVKLSIEKESFTSDEGLKVNVTISNEGRRSIKLLKWFTPFDEVEEDIFEVIVNGKPVEYIGRHYKRPAPQESDYFILKPRGSITRTVDLSEYYDLSATGNYIIKFRVGTESLYVPQKSDQPSFESLQSNNVEVWFEGRAAQFTEGPEISSVTGSSGFSSKCTTTKQTDIINARNQAVTYSTNALNYLLSGSITARYTTWFGSYNSGRYSTVTNNFTNIKNTLDGASMTFDCGCKKSYYAYVYPTQPYTVYLCNAFWTAPLTGTDSKAGTLIHETSHFNVVAATDDWVYGQSGAKNLAISDSTKAVDNADTHEYFAENTPFQQ